jgi:HD superfamily phosphodiesterase
MNTDAMRALLRGLLVGERQPVTSPDDWATRLDMTPLAERFVDHLRREWLPADPPTAFCADIAGQVQRRVAAWHPGWPHLWAHILRVTGVAVVLAREAGRDPALGYLAGMCHDVAKLDEARSGSPHEEMGATFAGVALRGHVLPAQIAAIQAAITHEGDDDLAHILNDADKLDKIGAVGIMRRVSGGTQWGWVAMALWEIEDDLADFPAMHFERSRALADDKRAFTRWFLKQAAPVVKDGV